MLVSLGFWFVSQVEQRPLLMARPEEDGAPEKCFVHPHASHFVNTFYFYAYGECSWE